MLSHHVEALKLIEDTRTFYYGPNWEPLPTRAAAPGGGNCEYSTPDGRHCAIGRLAPNAGWKENTNCMTFSNRTLTIELGRKMFPSWSEYVIITFFGHLQALHDEDEACEHHYNKLIHFVNNTNDSGELS